MQPQLYIRVHNVFMSVLFLCFWVIVLNILYVEQTVCYSLLLQTSITRYGFI